MADLSGPLRRSALERAARSAPTPPVRRPPQAPKSLVSEVESTMLADVFYNGETMELHVSYVKGHVPYTYIGVPLEIAQGLVNAPSKGKYMHAYVLGNYAYRRG